MALPIALALLASCKDSKSYSELLDDEEKSINSFLAHQKVLKQIPADTVFQTGADAPYYQIDDNGNVYMQVLKAGDRTNNRAQEGETIYFRFGRISINRWSAGQLRRPVIQQHIVQIFWRGSQLRLHKIWLRRCVAAGVCWH